MEQWLKFIIHLEKSENKYISIQRRSCIHLIEWKGSEFQQCQWQSLGISMTKIWNLCCPKIFRSEKSIEMTRHACLTRVVSILRNICGNQIRKMTQKIGYLVLLSCSSSPQDRFPILFVVFTNVGSILQNHQLVGIKQDNSHGITAHCQFILFTFKD